MKNLLKFTWLLFLPLLFACSSSDDADDEVIITKELKLSVPVMEEEWITTDKVDFEFEIIEGNGNYIATVPDEEDAKVTVDGNKVIVNLLNDLYVKVTITDSREQTASIYVASTNETLASIPGFGLHLDIGQVWTMNIDFGAGAPYTFEKIRGNAANASLEGNEVTATSLGLGDTTYTIRDKRGSSTTFRVSTSLDFTMDKNSNYLEIDGVNNLSSSVTLLWGTEWEIIASTRNIVEHVSIAKAFLTETGTWSDYYTLSIHTNDKGKGSDVVTLKNSDGELVAVKILIK